MNTAKRRRLTYVTLTLFLLIIGISFFQNLGKAQDFPLILNPKFKYFTKDSQTEMQKPFLWEATYTLGPNDSGFLRRDMVSDNECLGLHLYQDGSNDTYAWATIHVKQAIRGPDVSRLFRSDVSFWIYPTYSFVHDINSKEPRNVFGLEVNDGTHIIWFIFSDCAEQTYQLRNHRIVHKNAPLNQWSYVELDIGEEYAKAGWEEPSDLSFILICGATKITPGSYAGYFREINVYTR
ncbi:hypothetical protein [[Eubacterium] cellulosolvens]